MQGAWVRAAVLVLLAGCTVGEGIGAGAVGVHLLNECDKPVFAGPSGESANDAFRGLQDSPIRVATGNRSRISVVTNAAYEPTAYFVAIDVGHGDPEVFEFDLDLLRDRVVEVTVLADCETIDVPAGFGGGS